MRTMNPDQRCAFRVPVTQDLSVRCRRPGSEPGDDAKLYCSRHAPAPSPFREELRRALAQAEQWLGRSL